MESLCRLPGGFMHRRDDILWDWPGFPKELGEQSALSGHDRAAGNENVEKRVLAAAPRPSTC